MDKQIFISEIATYIQKYAPGYNIKVCSPIIAQAVLESGYGTSELAINAHNYFGLKYRAGRCKTCIGVYDMVGGEQNPDGSRFNAQMQWCKFKDMENGVIGYFDFINISNYANLKGVTNPQTYLERIKADGYATEIEYVKKLMSVIERWNLTQYDDAKKEETNMSNSPLVCYTKLSPNMTSPRKSAIKKITIHHMAGNLSVESCANVFADSSRQASSNYGIGTDGRIGLYVEEKNRAWTSSNADNDNQAVTIEVANDQINGNWHVSDKALAALIDLCVDICKRNGIAKLNFTGDKTGNLTMHKWFASTLCPGPYLESKFPYIADEVNKRLGTTTPVSTITAPVSFDTGLSFSVGDIVQFVGTVHYASAGAATGRAISPSRAKITAVSKAGKHPYHCRAVNSAGGFIGGVYGWVDASDVKPENFETASKPVTPQPTVTATTVKKARTTAPLATDKYWIHTSNGGLNECIEINNSGSCLPNCVGYAWGRFYEFTGQRPKLSKSNAENWYGYTADGYQRSQTPVVGAVMCWSKGIAGNAADGAGHVAIVEEVKPNGDVVTSNSAYSGTKFYMQTITKASGYSMGGGYTFQGFILPPGSVVVNTGSTTQKQDANTDWTPAVGEVVQFNGNVHYGTANAPTGGACIGGKAKVTKIFQLGQSKHPYHLIRVAGAGSTVYGWVDANSITKV